uniref:Uncharacterized protein n=1 Tax=Pipistrellus kuhlii TaxID=59472 RepID=A0A7J7QVZ5_PIPKU|nr:hypothetical protein mPipKuh1_008332 [Pipistrellus kuhlii]
MDTSQPIFSSSPEGHCFCVLLPGGQTVSAPGEGSLSWLRTRLCSPAPGRRLGVMEEKEPSVACGSRDGLQEAGLPSVAPSPAPALGESVRPLLWLGSVLGSVYGRLQAVLVRGRRRPGPQVSSLRAARGQAGAGVLTTRTHRCCSEGTGPLVCVFCPAVLVFTSSAASEQVCEGQRPWPLLLTCWLS